MITEAAEAEAEAEAVATTAANDAACVGGAVT